MPRGLLESTVRLSVSGTPQSRRFVISGAVQGVGYRFFAQGAAARASVSGYVRNLADGRVEIYAMGTAEQLSMLRRELETGPRFAAVSEVREENAAADPRYATDFVIERDF